MMPILEIEVDDDVAADIEALFADNPEWDEEERWSQLLWSGIHYIRYEQSEETRESEEQSQRSFEASRRKSKQEWEAATDPDVVWSAAALTGQPQADSTGWPHVRRGLSFEYDLEPDLARVAVWQEKAWFSRLGRVAPEAISVDLTEAADQKDVQRHVANVLNNVLSHNWSWLIWGSHGLLRKEEAPDASVSG